MSVETFDIGDSPTLTWLLYSDAAMTTPADATVVVTVKKPTGATVTPSVTHVGTGSYSAVVDCDVAGSWTVRWVATGALKAAEEMTFDVRRSGVL